jgi:peptide/nickel transport system permease protein
MRVADIQLAFPTVLLAIGVVGVLGPEPANIVITLAVSGWMVYARVVRSEVLSVKGREFVEAARVVGVPGHLILLRHILPNVLSSAIVIATFATAHMILLESSLSFLGLGIQPPTPSWGGMLSEGRDYISGAWWLSVFPGLAITATVLAINFVGDWVRDVLDPRFQPT